LARAAADRLVGMSKIILITGASSGIGAATARRLAAEGHTVVAGARRVSEIPAEATAVELDVTSRESVRRFVDDAVEAHGRIDAFVNNAGVMPLSRLDALLVDEWDRMVDVNFRGLLHGIAAVLPVFRRQDSGHFITVSSIGDREIPETSAVYSATKFAARAVTEGLRVESPPSIRVTTVSPGTTESELAGSITDPGAREAMRIYRANLIPADAIAQAISYAIGQPPSVDVNQLTIRPAAQR
jgi:NADP-dependent 3-hydroxy acid dehydrogenase YdfG